MGGCYPQTVAAIARSSGSDWCGDVLGGRQVLVRGAIAVAGQRHSLARCASAGGGPALQGVSVGVEPVLGQATEELIGADQDTLDNTQDAELGRHGEVGPNVSVQGPGWAGEVPAVR